MQKINFRHKAVSFIFVTFFLISSTYSQKGIGTITGNVKDSSSQELMEYVTVSLFSETDSTLITGTITDFNGNFKLDRIKEGNYFIQLSFVGYYPKRISGISISEETKEIKLENILFSNVLHLDEVVIKSNVPTIKYEIDKKVVNVEDMNTSLGQTAAQVLENVPSIKTDMEGNISIRGNTGFTLLINGVPSALDPNDALKAIPASTIKEIEIVTNPSVRMQAEGSAGIINIITKKSKLKGVSLLANTNVGNFGRYGGDLNFNYKNKSHSFNISGSYNHTNWYSERTQERISTYDSITNTVLKKGIHNWQSTNIDFNGGWVYDINEFNILSISSSWGRLYFDPFDYARYWEYKNDSLVNTYYNEEYEDIVIKTLSNTLTFKHNFDTTTKKHLTFTAIQNRRSVDEYVYADFYGENGKKNGGNTGTEFGPSDLLRFNLDFVTPLNKSISFEAGTQIQFGVSKDYRKNFRYDPTNMTDTLMPSFSTDVLYNRNIHGAYFLFKGKYKKIGYQAGLRGEYTFRKINATNIAASIQNIERLDFFPSFHFSYDISDDQQFLVSYSRRIERPVSFYFEPFISFQSLYSLSTGNPLLKPEFVNSFEASWIKDLHQKGNLSFELYSKALTNMIQTIPYPYDTNIIISTYENSGNSSSTGVEGNLTYSFTTFWTTNIGANLYHYLVNSTVAENIRKSTSTNWSLRWRNTITFLKEWKLQLMANYDSKTVSALGVESDNYGLDISLNKSFFDRKLALTAQVNNALSTRRNIQSSNINNVQVNNFRKPFAPIFVLTASLSINDYKKRSKEQEHIDDF